MKILIAEDDAVTRRKLEFILSRRDWQVVTAVDGVEALRLLQRDDAPTVAVIDLVMPKMNGIDLCREVRRSVRSIFPYLIILTVRGDTRDIIKGLAAGANDYLVKPFNVEELCARVNVGRRMIHLQESLVEKISELQGALSRISQLQELLRRDKNIYRFGPFQLEPSECRLLRDGMPIALSAKAFDLLVFLVQNRGHLITKDELMNVVWRGRVVEDNNLTVTISGLRKALDEEGTEAYIQTIPKRGYRFTSHVVVEES